MRFFKNRGGIGFAEIGRELGTIMLFAAIMLAVAIKRYRQTLDQLAAEGI